MSEKTEQPTHKKLRDARKKGDVPRSKDASKALLVWGLFGYLILFGDRIVTAMEALMQWSGENAYAPFPVVLPAFIDMAMQQLILAGLPVIGIVVLLGILGEVVITGPVFAVEKIKPGFDKLNVIGNVKNLFSMRNLIEALKSMIKVFALSYLLWDIIVSNIGPLMLVPAAGMPALNIALATLLKAVLITTALVFSVVAGIDILLQRQLYFRQQRMSKDEVKKEYKESEGNPEIKHARKGLHREIMMDSSRSAVRRASAVVVNPVHFAVAIRYEEDETPLPVVVAKGAGAYARMIVEEARYADVPVIQNIPLARGLMADAELDDYVPKHLLEATVEILRAVRDMGSRWE
ncbi:MAG TPA: type III secretion system export apparatus subunit SctU [Noviherbaspirillum sp.]|nr:type III secretion system export apparatus subunit SctU [Noviherbaspirillum sp.]